MATRIAGRGTSLLLWAACVLIAAAACRAGPPLEERLEALAERLDQQRREMHVPGMALAIVVDGEAVMVRGFGMARLDPPMPVSEKTIFCIGSSTKQFTAALVASLTDDGVMSFDDKVRDRLPELKFVDATTQEEATIADLLSHRTGLTRLSELWYSTSASQEEIIGAASRAEPYAGFREKFLYNNVMYLAVGMAAGKAAGSDWFTLVRERLLKPTGMIDTLVGCREAQGSGRLAKGYIWEEEKGSFKEARWRDIDGVAPAGAIFSNASDMARWLAFQLGDGAIGDTTIVSSVNLLRTREPLVTIGPGVSYGMGLMIRDYNGTTYYEHGGNIDGFASGLAFMPEKKIGVSVLLNVGASPLQAAVAEQVFRAVLDENYGTEDESEAMAPSKLAGYEGEYRFGPAVWTVHVESGKLHLDVPGQTDYELAWPDDDGKWAFAMFEAIKIRFNEDDTSKVTSFTLFQAGREMLVERVGLVRDFAAEPGALPAADMLRYFGKYHWEEAGADVSIVERDGGLAADVPGQMLYDLRWPDEEGRWRFRMTGDIYLTFSDEADAVQTVTFHQAGEETAMPRTGNVDVGALPTIDELVAGRAALHATGLLGKAASVRMSGTIRRPHQGLTGTFRAVASGPRRFRIEIDLPPFSRTVLGMRDGAAWADSSANGFEHLDGKRLEAAILQHPLALIDLWDDHFTSAAVRKRGTHDGRPVIIVALKMPTLGEVTAQVDEETGQVLEAEVFFVHEAIGAVKIPLKLDDYRQVDGVWVPFKMMMDLEEAGRTEVILDSVETGGELDDSVFDPPVTASQ